MVQIIEMFIPKSNKKTRPGKKMKPTSITIHETDNTNVRANARAHALLQYNGNPRQASWHLQIDDEKEVYQSIPFDETAWAAGDGANGPGNNTSIHCEICVNQDGNYKKAVANTIQVVKYLMKLYPSIKTVNVVQHNKWSGKNCPRHLRAGDWGINWSAFIAGVKAATETATKPVEPPKYETSNTNFKVGQTVRVKKSAKTYATGQPIANFVKGSTYKIVQRGSNRLLLSSINSWVKTSDVETVASTPNKPAPAKKTVAQMATEVIAGKHGNGHANRQKSLGISKSEYDKVKAEVNRIAGGKKSAPKKTISQMATEAIAGKHGNGHANRRKSLGISQADYNKVRAEVNRRSK